MTSSCVDIVKQVEHHVAMCVQEQLEKIFISKGRRAIVIAGPTGVGKTEISLKLAKMLSGEIISADSMQVYRGMDIGTAKATKEERELIPHHLIDIRDVTEPFNVYDYCKEAKAALEDIFNRGRVPIVVGGTGFYLHSLLYGPPEGPPADLQLREALEESAERLGLDLLYSKLEMFDPKYAATITPQDKNKVIRAIEIIELTGKKVSDFAWKSRPMLPQYDFRCWFLHLKRDRLYERLEARCKKMLEEGLLDEVKALDLLGIRNNRTASLSIGYRQTLDYLDSAQTESDYKQFVEKFIQASRHLAKRQFTWFRKEHVFRWVDVAEHEENALLEFLADDFHSPTPWLPEPTGN
jgi:tRNA dimethylallyltransferase